MRIISPKGIVDTETDGVVLMFNDDNELSSFISILVKTPVRSTGVRILSLIPDGKELTPMQIAILHILEGLDGIGGNDNEKICNDAADYLKDLLNKN